MRPVSPSVFIIAMHLDDQPAPGNYLDYFALSDDPFDSSPRPFFVGGARAELFPRLLHICQFSSAVLVVTGEEGVGKSALLAAMIDQLGQQDLICEIDVPLLSTREQIIQGIAQQFGLASLSDDIPIEVLVDRVKAFGSEADSGEALKIVLIDNAHNLDDETLETLLGLVEDRDDPHRQIHLVLLGKPHLKQRLESAEPADLLIQYLALQPLAKDELKGYLRFRLDAVDFKGVFPFRDEDIDFLWGVSRGNPAALNDPAREILIELAAPPPEPRALGLPVAHMVLIVSLVAGLLIAVLYQATNDDPDSPRRELPLALNDEAPLAPESGSSIDPDGGADAPEGSELQSDLPALQAPPPLDLPSPGQNPPSNPTGNGGNTPDPGSPEVVERQTAEPPANEGAPAAGDAREQVASRDSSGSGTTAPASSTPSPANQLSGDEAALLQRPPTAYTLQVLAGASRSAVDSFLARQANRAQLKVFAARRDTRTLYIVVAGEYPTAEAARAAVVKLPAEQQKGGPWPRSLQSVQADIRSFRGL